MKWPTKQLKVVDVAVYKQRIYFTDSAEVWAQCCEVMGDELNKNMLGFGGATMSWQSNETGIIIRLVGIFEKTTSVLVHECTHAAIDICTDTGIKITADNQEPFCYLSEFIFDKAAKALGIGQ